MPRQQSLGPALVWDAAALAALSRITPADLRAAAAQWQRDAPPAWRPLLDATTREPAA